VVVPTPRLLGAGDGLLMRRSSSHKPSPVFRCKTEAVGWPGEAAKKVRELLPRLPGRGTLRVYIGTLSRTGHSNSPKVKGGMFDEFKVENDAFGESVKKQSSKFG
jgi:hypothetical protein